MIKLKSGILTFILGLACLAGLSKAGALADTELGGEVTVLAPDHITLTPVNQINGYTGSIGWRVCA